MIYFIRHGESEANVRRVFAGQKDDSILTQKGKDQAKVAAIGIKNDGIKIDRIISSPLVRALETAQIIAEELNFDQSKILTDSRIMEYDMGSLSGTPWDVISSSILLKAEHIENPNFFHDRVYSCVKDLSKTKDNILIVSHAGVGRMLETIKEGKNPELFYDMPPYPNASITKIDWI